MSNVTLDQMFEGGSTVAASISAVLTVCGSLVPLLVLQFMTALYDSFENCWRFQLWDMGTSWDSLYIS